MNNHPDWAYRSPTLEHQTTSKAIQTENKIVTTIAVLVLSYYLLKYLDLRPETIKRTLFETVVTFTPAQFIFVMQLSMARLGILTRDGPLIRVVDLKSKQAKIEALSMLFGTSNTSITNVVRKARTMSGVDMILPPSTQLGPPGLGNWDNSCYQNSVIQGFASLPAFNEFITEEIAAMDVKQTDAPTHRALAAFLGLLNDPNSTRRTLWTPNVLKSMDSWQQQDAQEYFSRILDAIEKESTKFIKQQPCKYGLECIFEPEKENDAVRSKSAIELQQDHKRDEAKSTVNADTLPDTSAASTDLSQHVVRNIVSIPTPSVVGQSPMDGMLAQGLHCQSCGFTEGLSLTQFNCLTVNMGTGSHCTIEELLDEYTTIEEIEGVECTQCTKLASHNNDAQNSSNISTTESKALRKKPVLSTKAKQITIGRLPTDLVIHINRSIFDYYGNQRKNTSLVHFPLKLEFANKWCAPLDAERDAVQAIYDLKCVITHYGRHENGHYVAYAKKEQGWYCFNDEIVTQMTEEQVLQRGNAFMLFYEANNEHSSSPTPSRGNPSEKGLESTADKTFSSEIRGQDQFPTPPPSDSGCSAISEKFENEVVVQPQQGSPIPILRTAGDVPPMYRPSPVPSPSVAPVF